LRHKAKIDFRIGGGVVAGLALPLVSAVSTGNVWMYFVPLGIAALVFGCCYPQWYETTAEGLVIRAGLSRRTIPYSSITAVRPCPDQRSSVALSLDRLLIEHTNGLAIVAPKDKEAFLADVALRSPRLSQRGHELLLTGL
jgi:hypothetical protein